MFALSCQIKSALAKSTFHFIRQYGSLFLVDCKKMPFFTEQCTLKDFPPTEKKRVFSSPL